MPITPIGRYAQAWAEIVRHFRADPQLNRVVKTWREWRGDATDDDPPTRDQCPAVRLTPMARPINYQNSGPAGEPDSTDATLGVVFETWVAHDRAAGVADPMNLWSLIEAACRTGQVGDWLEPQFVSLREPAIPAGPESFDGTIWSCRGSIDVLIYGEG